MKVAHARGEEEVDVGARFEDGLFHCMWEVVTCLRERTYGPSGFGGTPLFGCKLVKGKMPDNWKGYQDADGLIEFCGDSIAASLYQWPAATSRSGRAES